VNSTTSSVAAADLQSPTKQKLPASQNLSETITLLAIDPNQEDFHSLLRILGTDGWNIRGASSLREATTLMNESLPDLILCEKDLSDGTWKDVFREAERLRRHTRFVVVSRHADERLWAEVLNLGAFDMILKPFDSTEILRMARWACHRDFPEQAAAASAA